MKKRIFGSMLLSMSLALATLSVPALAVDIDTLVKASPNVVGHSANEKNLTLSNDIHVLTIAKFHYNIVVAGRTVPDVPHGTSNTLPDMLSVYSTGSADTVPPFEWRFASMPFMDVTNLVTANNVKNAVIDYGVT